jgi:molybdopterin-guanine dinucleotide biosynthesis protein A
MPPERPHSHHGNEPPETRPPLEIPLYGPAPEWVRAVAEGLAGRLPADLRIGHVTDPAAPPGTPAAAYGPNRVRLSAPAWDARSWRAALADCDLVLTEGRPKPGLPGVLVLPPGAGTLAGSATESNTPDTLPVPSLLACVASSAQPGALPAGIPVFPPERLDALAGRIVEHARSLLAAAPLYGLVLGGGRSARMRADKAVLAYHGRPQTRHCLDLLAAHCPQAFVSCRADQAEAEGFAGLPQIHDSFLEMGPLGGILSALRAHPRAAFLVIACDLPFLDAGTLAGLAAARDPFKVATAFAGPRDGWVEPLCAIYEPRAYPRALQLVGQGIDCPRKIILNSSSKILPAPGERALFNANDPDAYRNALRALTGG